MFSYTQPACTTQKLVCRVNWNEAGMLELSQVIGLADLLEQVFRHRITLQVARSLLADGRNPPRRKEE